MINNLLETDELPGSTDLKVAKKLFLSHICLVAPESAKKSRILLELKVDDEMSAWLNELPPLVFGYPCNLKQAFILWPGNLAIFATWMGVLIPTILSS